MTGEWNTHIENWARHLRAAGQPDTTIALRTYHLKRCARELQLDLVDVTLEDLETWIGNPDWKPATKRSYRASLRVFWAWAMRPSDAWNDAPIRLPIAPRPSTLVSSSMLRITRGRPIGLLSRLCG